MKPLWAEAPVKRKRWATDISRLSTRPGGLVSALPPFECGNISLDWGSAVAGRGCDQGVRGRHPGLERGSTIGPDGADSDLPGYPSRDVLSGPMAMSPNRWTKVPETGEGPPRLDPNRYFSCRYGIHRKP